MNILYLGNFDSPNAEYISRSFEELGHTVTRRHEDFTTVDDALGLLNGIDFVLTEEARMKGDYIYGEILRGERDKCEGRFKEVMDKILVVPWLTNIQWGIERREPLIKENPIFKAPTIFTTDAGNDVKWHELGITHRTLRQGIYQGEAVMSEPDGSGEVGFVGEDNQYIWPFRKKLLNFLHRCYGNQFVWMGPGSRNKTVYHMELNRFCAKMKLIVGDSVLSPNYWSNRVYEIIGRGGVLIMPDIEGLDKEFIPFKHYIPYKQLDLIDLKDKVDYYLIHDKEREQIRKDGFEFCRANYTYKKRVEEIIKYVRNRSPKSFRH